jgi:hypothetical protein
MKKSIAKIDIGVEQLEDALKAYYDQRYFSAIVLAGAAEQLLGGYVMKHGLKPSFVSMRSAATKIANGLNAQAGDNASRSTKKSIVDLMNFAYNNSKLAGKTELTVELDPQREAQDVLDRAISNFDALFGVREYELRDIPLAQRFVRDTIPD